MEAFNIYGAIKSCKRAYINERKVRDTEYVQCTYF